MKDFAKKAADKSVLIDQDTGEITIDGEDFPFAVDESGPVIEVIGNHTTIVRIPVVIFAKKVDVRPADLKGADA